jgi:hypothetical protein
MKQRLNRESALDPPVEPTGEGMDPCDSVSLEYQRHPGA